MQITYHTAGFIYLRKVRLCLQQIKCLLEDAAALWLGDGTFPTLEFFENFPVGISIFAEKNIVCEWFLEQWGTLAFWDLPIVAGIGERLRGECCLPSGQTKFRGFSPTILGLGEVGAGSTSGFWTPADSSSLKEMSGNFSGSFIQFLRGSRWAFSLNALVPTSDIKS